MTTKEIVTQVWTTLLPVLRLEAFGTIKKDITEATNTTILELWDKVKPLFIEEFEDVKADLSDEDAQGAVRTALKKALDKDDALKADIEALLAKVQQAQAAGGGMTIDNQGAAIEKQVNIATNHGDLHF